MFIDFSDNSLPPITPPSERDRREDKYPVLLVMPTALQTLALDDRLSLLYKADEVVLIPPATIKFVRTPVDPALIVTENDADYCEVHNTAAIVFENWWTHFRRNAGSIDHNIDSADSNFLRKTCVTDKKAKALDQTQTFFCNLKNDLKNNEVATYAESCAIIRLTQKYLPDIQLSYLHDDDNNLLVPLDVKAATDFIDWNNLKHKSVQDLYERHGIRVKRPQAIPSRTSARGGYNL